MWLRPSLASFRLSCCILVVSAFFIELAREWGWYDEPSQRLGAAMSAFNSIVSQPWFVVIAVFFIGLAIGLWLHLIFLSRSKRQYSAEAPSDLPNVDDLPVVANEMFKSVIVPIDGIRFINCIFDDTLIQWEGGAFRFDGCHVGNNNHFLTHNRQLQTMLELARRIGMLNEEKLKRLQGDTAQAMMRARPAVLPTQKNDPADG